MDSDINRRSSKGQRGIANNEDEEEEVPISQSIGRWRLLALHDDDGVAAESQRPQDPRIWV